ncbi:MAG: hypothetical protein IKN85_05600 [Oscillospiraceae bacterium]|nr:hypothetical protein [Oscillospiraceae bacterium]MBR3535285.1 hypothetical protein [Oscillospiraceae bacterium]MBR6837912.1 hypothetical protein [Oscillospiraceae bacterium]
MKETMNDPYYNDEYAETEFTEEKKFPWRIINRIIAIVLFPFWSMAYIIVPGTSFVSFSIAFVLWLALCIVNLLLRNHKKALYICRAVTVLAVAGGFLPFILLMGFENSKMLYTVKKANYIYGVKSNNESYRTFLPEKLPEICEDYHFVTIGVLPIPDHISKSYLMFTTDADTIDACREHYRELGCERRDIDSDPDKEHSLSDYPDVKEEDFYYWFCSRAYLDESIQNDFEHNELYVKKERDKEKYSKAVLLNPDKRLVVILV